MKNYEKSLEKEWVRYSQLIEENKINLRIDDMADEPTNDRGEFICHGNITGYLDSHGSITQPGCFLESIPNFLVTGFILDTHSAMSGYHPTMKTTIGYYTNATEDQDGLLLVGKFHSTHAAQEVRTQLLERQEDGKSSAMSIGFEVPDDGSFYIYPKDYEELIPKYSKAEYAAGNVQRALSFPCIRIITRVDLIECSVCLVPSNIPSLIGEVRSFNSNGTSNLSLDDIYNNGNEKQIKIMSQEIRVAKRIGKDTYAKLDAHLTKLEDSHDDIKSKLDDIVKEHKDHGKLVKDARKTLDSLHSDDDDADEEKKDDKKDDDDKRSTNELYSMLESINQKLENVKK